MSEHEVHSKREMREFSLISAFLKRQSFIYLWLKKTPALKNLQESQGDACIVTLLCALNYQIVLVWVSLSSFSILWQFGAFKHKLIICYVLTFRSSYPSISASGGMWFGQLGEMMFYERRCGLITCRRRCTHWCCVVCVWSWQVPQESSHLPGVKRQHKDKLRHQLCREQRGEL